MITAATHIPTHSDLPDSALLKAYVSERDERAFAAIVARHGPLVLGVCRRVLRSEEDARDAFQATFLVLVMKARKVRPEYLGTWLFSVATRTSLRLRSDTQRRTTRERRFMELGGTSQAAEPRDIERDWMLDEQIDRLPGKYRDVVVLCFLQGKTKQEAAAELGWPDGTVSSRLNQARQILRRRLSRLGFGVSAVGLTECLSHMTAQTIPSELITSTLNAVSASGAASATVVALSRGIAKAMSIAKLKIAGMVFAPALLLGTTVAAVHLRGNSATQPPQSRPARTAAAGTQPSTRSAIALSPAVEKLIKQVAAQETKLKNLMVDGEVWEEISNDQSTAPWVRDKAGASMTLWCDGAASLRGRLDVHHQVNHWIQGAAPYYENSYTLAFDTESSRRFTYSDGPIGQVRPVNTAQILPPFTQNLSAGNFATGMAFSIFGGQGLSDFLSTYPRQVLEKRPGTPITVSEEEFDGVKSIRFSIGISDKIQESWWFDPNRSMAWLAYRSSNVEADGRRVCYLETRATKFSETAGQVWYPIEAYRYEAWFPSVTDHFAGPPRNVKGPRRRMYYKASKVVCNDPNFDPKVYSPLVPPGFVVTDQIHPAPR